MVQFTGIRGSSQGTEKWGKHELISKVDIGLFCTPTLNSFLNIKILN